MKRLSFLLLGLVLLVGFMSCNKTNTAQLAATLNAPDGTLAVLRDLATEGGDAVDQLADVVDEVGSQGVITLLVVLKPFAVIVGA